MLRKTLSILPLVCLALAGCDDRIHVNRSDKIFTKGLVVDKMYIAPQSFGVVQFQSSDYPNLYATSQTKEMYLIVLEVSEYSNHCNCTERFRTVYSTTPSLFAEVEAGTELDTEGNPNIKLMKVSLCDNQTKLPTK